MNPVQGRAPVTIPSIYLWSQLVVNMGENSWRDVVLRGAAHLSVTLSESSELVYLKAPINTLMGFPECISRHQTQSIALTSCLCLC